MGGEKSNAKVEKRGGTPNKNKYTDKKERGILKKNREEKELREKEKQKEMMRNWMVDKREQEKSERKVFPQDDTTITQKRDNEKISRVEAIAGKFGETEKSKREKERDKRAEEKKQMEKEKRSRNVMEKRGIYEGGKIQ